MTELVAWSLALAVALPLSAALYVWRRRQRRRRRQTEAFVQNLAELMLPRSYKRPKVDRRIQRRRYAR